MKLSICIPIYNFDVNPLVENLKNQINENNFDAEIILIDDASDQQFIEINKNLQSKISKFIFLEKNIGRAKIRNLFLKYCCSEYLLFLDCDVRIIHSDFIKTYFSEIEKNLNVELFYGGFVIDEKYKNLRNYYSEKREISNKFGSDDFNTFKTANFVVRKCIFEKFPFNEDLIQYGYEDYVFAKTLKQNAVSYLFINNPVMHLDHSNNTDFLRKVDLGMISLHQLSQDPLYIDKVDDIKVYKVAKKLKQLKLHGLFFMLYKSTEKKIIQNLLSKNPNIYFLDFYKLGKLIGIQHKK